MGKTSAIAWTDATWNPWRGCRKVSAGCKNCYMFREQRRYGKDPDVIVRSATTFRDPLKWKEPKKTFTCSWSDFFIEEADPWREEAWWVIRKTPHHTYQILTKRSENIRFRLPADWGAGYQNVWLGVTVEDQDSLIRAYTLATIPALIRFISYEPALEPIYLNGIHYNQFQWLISGGESGPDARPSSPEWFEDIRDQCRALGIAYFHKQNGGDKKIDGVWGGDLLNGNKYHEFPIVEKIK